MRVRCAVGVPLVFAEMRVTNDIAIAPSPGRSERPRALSPGSAGVAARMAAPLHACGALRLWFQGQCGLRILAYHGVIADADAGADWAPSYFVTRSQLREQLRIAAQFGPIVSLATALRSLSRGETLQSCIAITFDDVPAGAIHHGLPELDAIGAKATLFASTGHVSSGRLFDADVLRLAMERLRLDLPPELESLRANRLAFKRLPWPVLRAGVDRLEPRVRAAISESSYDALRAASWDELRHAAAAGHDIGGHTVDHMILGPQSAERRAAQIRESVDTIRSQLGACVGFAYPNGGPGDFDASDAQILAGCGVPYAVSTRPGFVRTGFEAYSLPRVGISAGHGGSSFALELCGLLDGRRARQAGWR